MSSPSSTPIEPQTKVPRDPLEPFADKQIEELKASELAELTRYIIRQENNEEKRERSMREWRRAYAVLCALQEEGRTYQELFGAKKEEFHKKVGGEVYTAARAYFQACKSIVQEKQRWETGNELNVVRDPKYEDRFQKHYEKKKETFKKALMLPDDI